VIELKNLSSFKFLTKQRPKKSKKELVIEALWSLKKEGLIRDFLCVYSVKQEIDFYIVYVSRDRYRVCPLRINRIYRRHNRDEINEIKIDFWETRDSIKNKILKIIEKRYLKN